jgi:transposase
VRLGRNPKPSSAGIVDSQSIKTTGVGGNERGFDPAKKVEGRKRHLLVDTEGLVLEVRVHSAKVPDEDGIRLLLEPARDRLGRLAQLWVDAGYQGRGRRWAEDALDLSVDVVRKPRRSLSPKRWPRLGQVGGLAEVHATARLQSIAKEMGCGKDSLLTGTEQEDEQGLRASAGDLRGVHLRGDDAPYSEEARPCLRIIRQSL